MDEISNNMMKLQEAVLGEDRKIARYLIVVMVRSACGSLKFPLGSFATNGESSILIST